jgi:hypothetical protein
VDLTRYAFSWRAIGRRLGATAGTIPKWMNVMRAMSSEGWGRIAYHTTIRRLLEQDPGVRGFMEGETDRLPPFYGDRIKRELGPLFAHLPAGAIMHDPNAYLRSSAASPIVALPAAGRRAARPREGAVTSSSPLEAV